jgi:hypothetical protein
VISRLAPAPLQVELEADYVLLSKVRQIDSCSTSPQAKVERSTQVLAHGPRSESLLRQVLEKAVEMCAKGPSPQSRERLIALEERLQHGPRYAQPALVVRGRSSTAGRSSAFRRFA